MAPVTYREEPCRTALNRVNGIEFFNWSLNPYMGCAHRCTFCYVRAYERRADRPWEDTYGTSVRVKVNVAEVLRRELARTSWQREFVVLGAATMRGVTGSVGTRGVLLFAATVALLLPYVVVFPAVQLVWLKGDRGTSRQT